MAAMSRSTRFEPEMCEQLERKDDRRKRGLASPDDGDALALTFAYPAHRGNREEERRIEEKLAVLRQRIR